MAFGIGSKHIGSMFDLSQASQSTEIGKFLMKVMNSSFITA